MYYSNWKCLWKHLRLQILIWSEVPLFKKKIRLPARYTVQVHFYSMLMHSVTTFLLHLVRTYLHDPVFPSAETQKLNSIPTHGSISSSCIIVSCFLVTPFIGMFHHHRKKLNKTSVEICLTGHNPWTSQRVHTVFVKL